MKNPIRYVLIGAGGCIATAWVLFLAGVLAERPALRIVGSWFAIVAFAVASLPLTGYFIGMLVERLRRTGRGEADDSQERSIK